MMLLMILHLIFPLDRLLIPIHIVSQRIQQRVRSEMNQAESEIKTNIKLPIQPARPDAGQDDADDEDATSFAGLPTIVNINIWSLRQMYGASTYH